MPSSAIGPHKLGRLMISGELILDMLKERGIGFPIDATFVSVQVDDQTHTVDLCFASDDLDEVPLGQEPPVIDATVRTEVLYWDLKTGTRK